MRQNVTDRAKRYRANQEGSRPEEPRICNYCGSESNVEVDHVDGVEGHGWPANLIWACRSCNTTKGANFRRLGVGVLTDQYNPAPRDGASSYSEWAAAVDALRGFGETSKAAVVRAVRKVQKTSFALRRQFARRMAKNPAGLLTLAEYLSSVNTLDNFRQGGPFQALDQAAATVANTPRSRFDRLAGEARRANPGHKYPTYEQYGAAVAMHQPGAHDAGGAIIHATPARLRSQYAKRIAQVKRSRRGSGGDVPF